MLTTISAASGLIGSIGAWFRFDDLEVPMRVLAAFAAMVIVFVAAWIFFALAWFHVWPFRVKNFGRRSKS